MTAVRTRFAPSPTGYLHIGGLRTALYSWLYARQNGGAFVLRIEDTDKERNTPEAVQAIFDGMRWAGLDWDEGPDVGGKFGPYRQTERLGLYKEYAERMVKEGTAYRCFATKEESEAARAAFVAQGNKAEAFAFQSPWRDRTDGDPSKPHVIRFKSPKDGVTGWDDLVRGRLDMPNKEIQDFVMIRGGDGIPLYNFACVVDDLTMEISHVVRGEDHIPNTAPQILMYRALGVEPPKFAHCPVILAQNGKKLSKRDAAVGVHEYEQPGYLPDALLNFLVRLGWSHGDQEIFSRKELIEKFDFEHVSAGGAKYDLKKLASIQGEHIRGLEPAEIARLAHPFVVARGLDVAADDPKLIEAMATIRIRASTLSDAAERVDFYFRSPPVDDAASVKKFLVPAAAPHLEAVAKLVRESEFTAEALEKAVTDWSTANNVAMKDFAQAVRVALTGRSAAPGLYEIMLVLGREESLARLERGAQVARG